MARSLWHYLKDLPPIDWAALVERAPRSSKGRKWPRSFGRRVSATKLARAKAKAKAAGKRRWAQQLADRRKQKMWNLDAVLLNAMEPGEWYGRPDITAASGAKRNSVHARLSRWERDGWIERAENEDWKPTVYRKGLGIDWQARGRPPRYLFRLTKRGERERHQQAFLA